MPPKNVNIQEWRDQVGTPWADHHTEAFHWTPIRSGLPSDVCNQSLQLWELVHSRGPKGDATASFASNPVLCPSWIDSCNSIEAILANDRLDKAPSILSVTEGSWGLALGGPIHGTNIGASECGHQIQCCGCNE